MKRKRGETSVPAFERTHAHRSQFIGRWNDDNEVQDPFHEERSYPSSQNQNVKPSSGDFVRCSLLEGVAHVDAIEATQDSPRAALLGVAAKLGIDPAYPDAVLEAVRETEASPWLDDATLQDETEIPYVTIDNADSRDLDQALHITKETNGYTVRYALADASHFVQPGTPLWLESMWRASSYYFPGFSIPMLPRALSEGLVSLNPEVDRRAMVMTLSLDSRGACQSTTLRRAKIRSRAKLSYRGVQEHLDGTKKLPVSDAIACSLEELRRVGELRMQDASERNIIRYRRSEVSVHLGRNDMRFVALTRPRNMVERYNEQLSLLCNVEGAKFLRAGDRPDDEIHPIYRVHPAPEARRFAAFEALLEDVAAAQPKPSHWRWTRATGALATFLSNLPSSGREGRVAQAIHRQAVMMNLRSSFSERPDRHYGVGAQAYARFSAPMREMVGVFLHKETWEKLGAEPAHDDEAARDIVIARANDAKARQAQVAREANLLVLEQLFTDHKARNAPLRGTVVGITRNKAHVLLDEPAIDVKVYFRHLPGNVRANETETQAHRDGEVAFRLGDAATLRAEGRDKEGRWMLQPTGS